MSEEEMWYQPRILKVISTFIENLQCACHNDTRKRWPDPHFTEGETGSERQVPQLTQGHPERDRVRVSGISVEPPGYLSSIYFRKTRQPGMHRSPGMNTLLPFCSRHDPLAMTASNQVSGHWFWDAVFGQVPHCCHQAVVPCRASSWLNDLGFK